MSRHFFSRKLNMIPQSTRFKVLGYIRNCECERKLNIPMMLKIICLSYYYIDEHFRSAENLQLNENKKIAINNHSRGNMISAYGSIIIDSLCRNIYCWKFKIIEHGFGIGIGIESVDKKHYFMYQNNGYKTQNNGANVCSELYNTLFYDGDLVCMEFNCRKKILSFSVETCYKKKHKKKKHLIIFRWMME
eukprot:288125_1